MEHLRILETILDYHDVKNCWTPMYIFSAAIYDTWSNGNELEKNLASRLVQKWSDDLLGIMDFDYSQTKHHPERKEVEEYNKSWIKTMEAKYADHNGLCAALKMLSSTL